MPKINQTTWIVALSTIDSGISNELAEPEFPGIVNITNPEGGRIINFTAGTEGTSPITGYVASVIPSGPTATVVSADLAVGGYVELSDFTYDVGYIVSISAVNEFGQGEAAYTNSFIIEDLYNEASGGTETIVYDYNGTGERWKVHTFESNGILEITESPQTFSTLIVAGGNGANYVVGIPANGGEVIENIGMLSNSQVSVVVGSGGVGGQGGNAQPGGVSQFGSDTANAGMTATQVNSTITGTSTPYGGDGSRPIARGRGGMGAANTGEGGQSGIVVIAYETSNAFNAATGGTITIIDDFESTGEKWAQHTFTASDTFALSSAQQPIKVRLIAKGGSSGYADCPMHGGTNGGGAGAYEWDGSLTVGDYAVTVGTANSKANTNGGSSTVEGVGTVGGGGNGLRGAYNSDVGPGAAGTWGGTSNGAAGGTDMYKPSAFTTLWDGQAVGWGYGAAARAPSECGANLPLQNGIVAIAYQIGVSTFAEVKVAQTVRKAQLRKQQLEEKALKKQQALEDKLRK